MKNFWHKIVRERQILLLLLFAFILLLPNIFLSLSGSMSIFERMVNIFLPMGVYLLLLSITKRPGVMMLWLSPLVLLATLQLFLIYLFGPMPVAVDMMLNLFTSDSGEAGELLSSLLPGVVVAALMLGSTIALMIYSFRSQHIASLKRRKQISLVAVLSILISLLPSYAYHKRERHYKPTTLLYPINVGYNVYLTAKKLQQILSYKEHISGFSFSAKRVGEHPEREVYVLIVGETSRPMNWQLYGYDQPTTPRLMARKKELTVYPNVMTQSNTTHKSVPILLSPTEAENASELYDVKGITSAFEEADFFTAFLSNQPPNRSYTDFFAEQSSLHRSLRGGLMGEQKVDGDLLPLLDELLSSEKEKLFIVLHTYGSHYDYKDRYPEGFTPFGKPEPHKLKRKFREKIVGSYNNAIAYTDYLIDEVISRLERYEREKGGQSFMLYVSDHGEDLLDDERARFLHSTPDVTAYQLYVPMLLWHSQSYKHPNIHFLQENRLLPLATNTVFHTMLDAAEIETPYLRKDRSLFRQLEPQERSYLNDHDECVPVWSMTQDEALDRAVAKSFEQKSLEALAE